MLKIKQSSGGVSDMPKSRLTAITQKGNNTMPTGRFFKFMACAAAAGLLFFQNPDAGTFTPIPSTTNDSVNAFLNTANAKLVYVLVNSNEDDGGPLWYIDFSEKTGVPAPHRIAAVQSAHVPVISPDGK